MTATVKLVMALVWLFLGGCIFYWQWTHPDRPGMTIWKTGISIGWGLILLSLYNLIWSWIVRSNQKRQRAMAEAEAQRQKEMRRRTHSPPEFNPIFDFTDRPSPGGPKSS